MSDFFERAQPMFDLYTQGSFEEALRLTEELAREFPDRTIYTSYWKMCLLAVTGRKEEALQVMKAAVAKGLWWSEDRLRRETDMQDLQGNPEFERLLVICVERYNQAKSQTKPELLILEPNAARPTSYPMLMIFHGRDGSAAREKHDWQSAPDLGWLTVFAQSSQIGSLDSYVWDDLELARQEIQKHFKDLQEKYPLDTSRIVLGGISQGGSLAILSALKGDVPCTGFLAVVPGRGINMEEIPDLTGPAKERDLCGVIVAGGKDPRFESFGQLSNTLSANGIPCQLEIRPDVGHAYPPDFREILEKYLQNF